MRIGKRWPAGTTPPAAIPDEMAAAIRDAEETDPSLRTGMWTLTFLEQRPVATHDEGAIVELADAEADEDDWLA